MFESPSEPGSSRARRPRWSLALTALVVLGSVTATAQDDGKPPPVLTDEAVIATLQSASFIPDRSYGKLEELLSQITSATGLTVVTETDCKPATMSYRLSSGRVPTAHDAIARVARSTKLAFEGYAGVLYLGRAPLNPRPPAIERGEASAEALARLDERVSLSLPEETFEDALATFSDVFGLTCRFSDKEEAEQGYTTPKGETKIELELPEMPTRRIIELLQRRYGLGATLKGEELVFWSFDLKTDSAVVESLNKALQEPLEQPFKATTLAELARELSETLEAPVLIEDGLGASPVKAPPAGLPLRSALFLAPGVDSGIDHRVIGDALVFERRTGRKRPEPLTELAKADTTLRVALQLRRLELDETARPLGELCAELNRRFDTIQIVTAPAVAGRKVTLALETMRLGAVLEHIARVSGTLLKGEGARASFEERP